MCLSPFRKNSELFAAVNTIAIKYTCKSVQMQWVQRSAV